MAARTVKKPEERRAEILEAAHRLFAEKGYEATSVCEIVKSVGVAQGTFYWYFKSKEEVFREVARAYADALVRDIKTMGERDDLTAVAKMKMMFRSLAAPDESEDGLIESLHSPAGRALHDSIAREVMREIRPLVEALVRQGVEEGSFATDYPEETAAFMLATMIAVGGVDSMVEIGDLDEEGRTRWTKAFSCYLAHGLGYTGEEGFDLFDDPGA